MGEDTGGECNMNLDISSSHTGNTVKASKKSALSCRLHMSFQGLEWFIYNRTAAYDNIIQAMDGSNLEPELDTGGRPSTEGRRSLRKIFSWSSAVPESE